MTTCSHGRLVPGGVRERPNRAVSKTAVSTGTVGSNPTSSAIDKTGDVSHPSCRARDRVLKHNYDGKV